MMMKAYQDQTTEKVQKTAFHQMEDADFLSDVGNGHDNTEQTELTEITMHMDSEQDNSSALVDINCDEQDQPGKGPIQNEHSLIRDFEINPDSYYRFNTSTQNGLLQQHAIANSNCTLQDSSSTVNYNSNGQDQEMQVVMSQGGTSYVLSQGGTSYTSLTKQFMTGSLVGNYAQQNYEDFLSTDTTCSFMDLLNQPLQTEVLQQTNRKSKTKATNMAPGGRLSKRVRAYQGGLGIRPGVVTKSGKRPLISENNVQTEELPQDVDEGRRESPQDVVEGRQESPQDVFEERQGSPCRDALSNHEANDDGIGVGGEENEAGGKYQTGLDNQCTEASGERAPRRSRQQTKGLLLESMTKSMGRRMPIAVAEGQRRPHDPVQAAKFASEAGVIIRDNIPVLTHWKEYKKNTAHYDSFKGMLSNQVDIDDKQPPTMAADTDVLRSGVRQTRYRLKKKVLQWCTYRSD
ncbi:uncharacterized protein LOC120651728 isoform X2 [Panicum virgatum]|uniref:uncharacterized protein LOC120651728 isoform X2 n=1 Tax=Panicum virgatum TaxID=38727 RepID=UPI0019D5A90C|nr:uncharacterized protein LOC120651728 isoform X2 [Panicum virgatum]